MPEFPFRFTPGARKPWDSYDFFHFSIVAFWRIQQCVFHLDPISLKFHLDSWPKIWAWTLSDCELWYIECIISALCNVANENLWLKQFFILNVCYLKMHLLSIYGHRITNFQIIFSPPLLTWINLRPAHWMWIDNK